MVGRQEKGGTVFANIHYYYDLLKSIDSREQSWNENNIVYTTEVG